MQQRSKFFVPGIIMIGIVLRTPFTILPMSYQILLMDYMSLSAHLDC